MAADPKAPLPGREPSITDALVPLAALTLLIAASLALLGLDALDGPIQVALILCCAVAALIRTWNLSGTIPTLVPWNSSGAFMGAALGVATLSYPPFAFFDIASPVLSVIYGFTGFKIVPGSPAQEHEGVA